MNEEEFDTTPFEPIENAFEQEVVDPVIKLVPGRRSLQLRTDGVEAAKNFVTGCEKNNFGYILLRSNGLVWTHAQLNLEFSSAAESRKGQDVIHLRREIAKAEAISEGLKKLFAIDGMRELLKTNNIQDIFDQETRPEVKRMLIQLMIHQQKFES